MAKQTAPKKTTAKKPAGKTRAARKPAVAKTIAGAKKQAIRNLKKQIAEGYVPTDKEWDRLSEYDAPKEKAAAVDMSDHEWPNVAAAASEFGVVEATIRNWCNGFGIPCNRCAISKAALYASLWQKSEATLNEKQNENDLEEQRLRIQRAQAKADRETGRLIEAANDNARSAMIKLLTQFISALLNSTPADITDEFAESKASDSLSQQTIIHQKIKQFLDKFMHDKALEAKKESNHES